MSASSSQDVRFRPLGRGTFIGGVFVTLLIHAALLAAGWYGSIKAPIPEVGEREVVITRLIQLGKPREKFWLPRIVQPPKPKVVEPTIKIAEDPNAKPAEKEKEKEKPPEKPELSKKVQDVLNKRRAMLQAAAEEPPEGSLTGSASGTSNTASEGDEYATQIYEAIKKNWTVPTGLSIGDVITFEAHIRISISEDGTILEPKLKKSSGNSLYDDSCLQAVQATRKVPPPPAAQRARYRRGVALAFGGKDLAR